MTTRPTPPSGRAPFTPSGPTPPFTPSGVEGLRAIAALLLCLLATSAFAARHGPRHLPLAPATATPASTAAAPADAGTPSPSGISLAHPQSVSAALSAEKVKLGEPFVYDIEVIHAPSERYELRAPTELGAFELLGQTRAREDGPSQTTTHFALKLSLFELGKQQLPTLVFDVVTPTGTKRLELAGKFVEGLSSLPADTQSKGAELMDIKPPEDVPVRTWRLLYLAAGVLAAGALGYLLYRQLKKPRAPKPVPAAIVLPVDVRAETALRELEREGLPGQGRVREFYFRLSDIVRGYLGERYGIDALECTSSELLGRVERLTSRELPRAALRDFINESDFAKFAKAEPDADACAHALGFGFDLVKTTRPAATSAPATPLPANTRPL